MSFHVLLLVTSTNPPRSCTYTYSLYRSNGVFEIVGQAVIGDLRSSMYASSLSRNTRRSGLSSISYSLFRLSDFCGLAGVRGQDVGDELSSKSSCALCGPGDAFADDGVLVPVKWLWL